MFFPLISLFASLLALLVPSLARADVYPWVQNTELYPLVDPHVDMALRIKLIDEAQETVRIICYDQRTDSEVGMPILHALRRAAKRGVKVWFIEARVSSYLYDKHNFVGYMLADPDLPRPGNIISFGGVPNLRRGWFMFDSVHEKIFLVDDKIAITGGRNHGGAYLSWLDSGYAIKGELVQQFVIAFRKTWNHAASVSNPFRPGFVGIEKLPLSSDTEIKLNDLQKLELANVFAVEPVRPGRTRVITNNFLGHIKTGRYNGENRKKIPDDTLDEIIELVERAQDIRLSTLYAGLHPRLKTALIEALKRGAALSIFFNGEEASGGLVPGALSYVGSLEDLLELMRVKQADGSPAKVRVATFHKKNNLVYLHKKTLIVDDHVFFGSHNFNRPSTYFNSELTVEVDDAAFATAVRRDYDADFMFFGKTLTMEDVAAEFQRTASGRPFAWLVEGLF